MKVAVISVVPTCGKTVLCEILGGVYSRSQGTKTAILSTGQNKDLTEIVDCEDAVNTENPYVLKAIVENSSAEDKDLLNYGARAGDEFVYVYDIMNSIMSEKEKQDFLVSAIDNIPADLTLVEIVGDYNSELNREVYKHCNCMLVLVPQSKKGMRKFKEFMDNFPNPLLKMNSAVVLAQDDPLICSDKKFCEQLSMKVTSLFRVPKNPVISKLAFDGRLDRIIYDILIGESSVVNLRAPMQELMCFIFDDDRRKIIRSVDRWFR